MPFDTPGHLSNEEIKDLKKETETATKSDKMKDIFSKQENYKNFIKERDSYMERTTNETAKKYIGSLFEAVINKYIDEIKKLTPNNKPQEAHTETTISSPAAAINKPVERVKLSQFPYNHANEPVSLYDYNSPENMDMGVINMNSIFIYEVRSLGNKKHHTEDASPISMLSMDENISSMLNSDDVNKVKDAMKNALTSLPPLLITQKNRDSPESKKQFITMMRTAQDTFLQKTMELIGAQQGLDKSAIEAKISQMRTTFAAQMPTDQELISYYEGLIHALSHISNEIKKMYEDNKSRYEQGEWGFRRDKVSRYENEASDITDIVSNVHFKSKFLSSKERMFSAGDEELKFSKNLKRTKETLVQGGQTINYYFSKSQNETGGFVYNIERETSDGRTLLQIDSTGKYKGIIIQPNIVLPGNENTTGYRQGLYEEYASYERSAAITNLLNKIKGEMLDLNLNADLGA